MTLLLSFKVSSALLWTAEVFQRCSQYFWWNGKIWFWVKLGLQTSSGLALVQTPQNAKTTWHLSCCDKEEDLSKLQSTLFLWSQSYCTFYQWEVATPKCSLLSFVWSSVSFSLALRKHVSFCFKMSSKRTDYLSYQIIALSLVIGSSFLHGHNIPSPSLTLETVPTPVWVLCVFFIFQQLNHAQKYFLYQFTSFFGLEDTCRACGGFWDLPSLLSVRKGSMHRLRLLRGKLRLQLNCRREIRELALISIVVFTH